VEITTKSYPSQQAYEIDLPQMVEKGWVADDIWKALSRMNYIPGLGLVVTWIRKGPIDVEVV
jgi:hypothetical protein